MYYSHVNSIILIVIFAVVAFIVFLLMREFWGWYFKINKRVEQNEKIIALLEEINDKDNKNQLSKGA